MKLGVDFNILNQKGTPAFYSDIFANRPAAGFAGRVFISTDTGAIYEDTGSAWTLIADAGAGTTGTLEQVTTNGNTTTKGLVVTSGNVAIGTATAGAPLDIHATGTNAQFNGTGANNAYLQFQNAGTSKWRIGNTYAAGVNNYEVYNNPNTTTAISINGTTSVLTVNKGTRLGGTSGDDQLYVYGTSPSMRLYNTLTSPTITGFIGMATATNNFIQTSASGDMAIGTSTGGKILFGTASGTVSPQMALTNAGILSLNSITPSFPAGTGLYVNDATRSNLSLTDGTNILNIWQSGVNAAFNLVSTGDMLWRNTAGNTERMRLTNNGNLLIGTSTNGGSKLKIVGLPTSAAGLTSGDIYSNLGILTIVP
jgi:trimeric autotransporter adhesin